MFLNSNSRPRRATRALMLACAAWLLAGCSDDLPGGASLPDGLSAPGYPAPGLSAPGLSAPGHSAPGLARGAGADGREAGPEGAFVVGEGPELSSKLLVGAEWFEVRFTVHVPAGRFVTAYGLKTPYETVVKPVSPRLPLAIPGGAMVLRRVHFNRIPVAGDYPLEIWLINDAGEESNHVFGRVTVQ